MTEIKKIDWYDNVETWLCKKTKITIAALVTMLAIGSWLAICKWYCSSQQEIEELKKAQESITKI